jgi:anti-sigma factor RsiW
MSTQDKDQTPSDEMLTAFIDGEIDAEEAAKIEAQIDGDPSVAIRFDRLSRADLPYGAAFEPLLEEAPIDRLAAMLAAIPSTETQSRHVFGMGRRGFLGAAAACLIAGIVGDRAFITIDRRLHKPGEGEEWRAVVAQYIELYTPDTLSAPAGDRAAQVAQLDQVGSKIGLSLSPETIALSGADFRRAQVLEYDGEPLAQLAYLEPDGPMALCIVKSARGAAEPDMESRRGMNVVYWSTKDHAFMLIGHAAVDRMKAVADDVRARLSA